VDIIEVRDSKNGRWDQYVWDSPQANPFHLLGWKNVLQKAFDLKPVYLVAKDDDDIKGILPLIPISSKLTGNYVTSMPGGVCADSEDVAADLLKEAKELTKKINAKYLILRDCRQKLDLPHLVTNEDHCTFLVELHDDPQVNWYEINRRVRQSTKKAMRADLEVIFGQDHLGEFYPVYAGALQERGTPTQGLSFFKNLLAEFPSIFNIVVVCREDHALGGGFVALFKDTIYNTWGGMLRQYYNMRTNYLLYWETLKYGCENGFQWVDLGRCEWDSGVFNFKKQWAGQPKPLYQQYFLNGISQPPAVGNQRAEEFQYRLFIGLWKLLPLPVTEALGFRLRKRMPFG
jgi:serine/alanine adding enzyme